MKELRAVKDNQFVTGILTSFSQVILIENWKTGLCIFIALLVADLKVGLAAMISSIVGNLVARLFFQSLNDIKQGLLGFSAILSGIAIVTFFLGISVWLLVVFAAALATIFTILLQRLFANLQLPSLTFPFILVIWLFLLASYQSETITSSVTAALPSVAETNGKFVFPDILLKGIGEIFLLDNVFSSMIILFGIVIASRFLAMMTLIGIGASLGLGFFWGMNLTTLSLGLYTYNAILTILALALFLEEKSVRTKVVAMVFGLFLTSLLDLALPAVIGITGLPVLTFPFVVAVWGTLILVQSLEKKALETTTVE